MAVCRRTFRTARTDGPQICLGIVLFVAQYFWCHVQRRSAQCFRQRGGWQIPSKAKVGDLDERNFAGVAGGEAFVVGDLQEQVLGLDIAVHNVATAEEAHG